MEEDRRKTEDIIKKYGENARKVLQIIKEEKEKNDTKHN